MICIDFPVYFDTRLKNNLKKMGIAPSDLLFNIKVIENLLSLNNNGIGIVSLLKITRFRCDMYATFGIGD